VERTPVDQLDENASVPDRAKVASGQKHEVSYEAKAGRSASAVKMAVKKVGVSWKKVERRRGR
jgi:hypothetical protein